MVWPYDDDLHDYRGGMPVGAPRPQVVDISGMVDQAPMVVPIPGVTIEPSPSLEEQERAYYGDLSPLRQPPQPDMSFSLEEADALAAGPGAAPDMTGAPPEAMRTVPIGGLAAMARQRDPRQRSLQVPERLRAERPEPQPSAPQEQSGGDGLISPRTAGTIGQLIAAAKMFGTAATGSATPQSTAQYAREAQGARDYTERAGVRAHQMAAAQAQAQRQAEQEQYERALQMAAEQRAQQSHELAMGEPEREAQQLEARRAFEEEQRQRQRAEGLQDFQTQQQIRTDERIRFAEATDEERLNRAIAAGGNAGMAVRRRARQLMDGGLAPGEIQGGRSGGPIDTWEDAYGRAILEQFGPEAEDRPEWAREAAEAITAAPRRERSGLRQELREAAGDFAGRREDRGERYGAALTRTNTVGLRRNINRVREAIAKARQEHGDDIPGVGLSGFLTETAGPAGRLFLSEEGREVRGAVQELLDTRLRAATGANAPPSEVQTFAQILGVGDFSTDRDLLRGLDQAEAWIRAQEENLAGTFGPDAVDQYNRNISRSRSRGQSGPRGSVREQTPQGGGDTVRVRDPNGNTGSIPRDRLEAARAAGYEVLE